MKPSDRRDQIEFAELSKLTNKKKVRDIGSYNLGNIEKAVKYDRSMNSVERKLGIRQRNIHAMRGKQRNVISYFGDLVKAPDEFYTDL